MRAYSGHDTGHCTGHCTGAARSVCWGVFCLALLAVGLGCLTPASHALGPQGSGPPDPLADRLPADEDSLNCYMPLAMAAGNSGLAVTAGYFHTCALTSQGGVKCWGSNQQGQVGDGTLSDGEAGLRLAAVDVMGLTRGVNAISVGDFHTCAVTTTGGAKCWGYNGHGELGDGTYVKHPVLEAAENQSTPVAVVGFERATMASAQRCAEARTKRSMVFCG